MTLVSVNTVTAPLLSCRLISTGACLRTDIPATHSILQSVPEARIPVVGVGIGSAAVQHFLHTHLQKAHNVNIDVFEAESRVGGRIGSLRLSETQHIETGASIIHSSNLYMKSFAKQFNLTTQQPKQPDSRFAI